MDERVLEKGVICLKLSIVINVEITMAMAVVGMGSLLIHNVVNLINMKAMTDIISFIVVGVMTFVESTGVNFGHDKPSD